MWQFLRRPNGNFVPGGRYSFQSSTARFLILPLIFLLSSVSLSRAQSSYTVSYEGGVVKANRTRLAGGALTSGVPQRFILPPVSEPTFFSDALYQFQIPGVAGRIQIDIAADDPLLDVDLFVARGSSLAGPDEATHRSTTSLGAESVVVPFPSRDWVIGLAVKTLNRQITGTIRATALASSSSQGPELTSSRPVGFALTSGTASTRTFEVVVPQNAQSLEIRTETLRSANVDLSARSPISSRPEHFASTPSGNELMIIRRNGTPPLRTGRYTIGVSLPAGVPNAEGLVIAKLTTDPPATKSYSDASLKEGQAAVDSAVVTRGQDIVFVPEGASGETLPEVISGASVTLRDSADQEGGVSLLSASSNEIRWLVPEWAKPGPATVKVRTHQGQEQLGPLRIGPVAPALYSADGSGKGPAMASAVRTSEDGTEVPLTVSTCQQNRCQLTPLDLGQESAITTVRVVGTGFRHATGLACRLGGEDAKILRHGPHETLPGRDIVDIEVPRSLFGVGEVDLKLTADELESNSVTVSIGGPGGKFIPKLTAIQPVRTGRSRTLSSVRASGQFLSEVTAIEFEPAEGLTVSNIRPTASSVTFDLTVSADAAFGERRVFAVSQVGKSSPVTFEIVEAEPPGPPRITDLVVTQTRSGNFTTVFRFNFTDPDGDMSLRPVFSIWADGGNALCGTFTSGQTSDDGLFAGTVELRFTHPGGVLLRPPVEIDVSVQDAAGRRSNTLSVRRDTEFVCP